MLPSLRPPGMIPLDMATISKGLTGVFVAQSVAYVKRSRLCQKATRQV
jgi:hypothetical protein